MQHIFYSWSHTHKSKILFHLVQITAGWTKEVWIQPAQGFYTWPALRESNPKRLDLGSNVLTTQPRTPQVRTDWFVLVSMWCEKFFALWNCKTHDTNPDRQHLIDHYLLLYSLVILTIDNRRHRQHHPVLIVDNWINRLIFYDRQVVLELLITLKQKIRLGP